MTLVERRPRWGALVLATGAVMAGIVLVVIGGDSARSPEARRDAAAPATSTTTAAAAPGEPVAPVEVPAELRPLRPADGRYVGALRDQRIVIAVGERLWVLDGASGEQIRFELPSDGLHSLVGRRSGVVAVSSGRPVVVRDPARYPVVPGASLGREPAEWVLGGLQEDEVWLSRREGSVLVLTRVDVRTRRPIARLDVTFEGDAPVPLAVTDVGIVVGVPDHEDHRLLVVDPDGGTIARVVDGPRFVTAAGGATAVGIEPDEARPGTERLLLTDLVAGTSRAVLADERVAGYRGAAAVSPDGRTVAVGVAVADSVLGRDRDGLALVDVASARVRAVTAHPGWGGGPVWSVDSRFVYGLTTLPLDHSRLAVTAWSDDGGQLRALRVPVEVRPGPAGVHLAALWPPDLDR